MAARRCEISLLVWKKYFTSERSERVKYFPTLEEKFRISKPSGHVMFYLLYKHQWNTKSFHFNSFFGVKAAVNYVAIATVIFSQVNFTCEDIIFSRESSPGISLVFI